MEEGGQVVIPDLDATDWFAEAALAPPPSLQSPGTWSMSDGLMSPVEETRRTRAPMAGVANGGGESARYGAALDYFSTPPRSSDRTATTPFSRPVKKPSFASLRAAIKGQPSSDALPADDVRRGPSRTTENAAFGLAQVTGINRPMRIHGKSGSQTSNPASASGWDADLSINTSSLRSPSRNMRASRQHTRHGSHFSEHSIETGSISPSCSNGPPLPASDTTMNLSDLTAAPDWVYDVTTENGIDIFGGPIRNGLVDPMPRMAIRNLRTPLVSALEEVLRRFVAAADNSSYALLHASNDTNAMHALFPSRESAMSFDAVLDAIQHVAKHNTVMVIDSLLAWRSMTLNPAESNNTLPSLPSNVSLSSSSSTPVNGIAMRRRGSDASTSSLTLSDETASRRKALAVTYLVCRALLRAIPEQPSADPDSTARLKERSSLPPLDVMLQQQCFDTVARLLGALSRVRLSAISDQFIQILKQSNALSPSRNHELLTEAAILGMRYIRIAVYPMELFEEGAELVSFLAQYFAHSHGYRIKRALSRVLCALILPVASTASAERHHPTWNRALQLMLPKAQQMAVRTRYWSVALPLWTAALCAAPPEMILSQFSQCLDTAFTRLKDRSARPVVLQCATQILHSYLFHCHEGTNATTKRLNAFFTQFQVVPKPGIPPPDTHLDHNVSQLHFTLYRQFDYGRDQVLDMLLHSVFQDRTVVHQPELLQPTKMRIAIRAVSRTVQSYLGTEPPAFPESPDAMSMSSSARHEDVASLVDASKINYPNVTVSSTYATFFELIGHIALIADYQVKDVNVFHPQLAIAKGTSLPTMPGDRSAQDREHYVVRTHASGSFTVVYAREQQAYIDLLRTCFDAWPLGLSPTLAMPTVLTTLFRAQYSTEPALQRASAAALKRIALQSTERAHNVVQAYLRWAIRQDGFVWELVPHAEILLPKMSLTIGLFIDLLDIWWMQRRYDTTNEDVLETLDEIEGCAMYLLCTPSVPLRQQALTVLRLLSILHGDCVPRAKQSSARRSMHLLDQGRGMYLTPDRPELSASHRARVAKWDKELPLSSLCTAHDSISQSLWHYALPSLLQAFAVAMPMSATAFYLHMLARVKAIDASLTPRTRNSVTPFARGCWRTYTTALCATTALDTPDVPRADVVPMLVPYLSSEDSDLRDSAAHALGYTQQSVYVPLLAALHASARPAQEETRLTLARVYMAKVVFHTAPQMPSIATDPRAVRLVGAWVQDTFTFLQARAGLPTVDLCALRRYFVATVSAYFKALQVEAPTHFPDSMRVEIFAMFDDWHDVQDAQRLAAQLSAAAEQCVDAKQKERVIVQQRQELQLLAVEAERGMAVLCAGSAIDAKHKTPLAWPRVLQWIESCLNHAEVPTRELGGEALQLLLSHNPTHSALIQAVLRRSFKDLQASQASRSFFVHLAISYVDGAVHFPDESVIALALMHLAHDDASVRAHAIDVLDTVLVRLNLRFLLVPYAVKVTSPQPVAYHEAQGRLSHSLNEHLHHLQVAQVLIAHFEVLPDSSHEGALRVLAPWIQNISTQASSFALLAQLTFLMMKYGDLHPLAVKTLWMHAIGAMDGALLAEFALHLALSACSVDRIAYAQRIVVMMDHQQVRTSMLSWLCACLRPSATIKSTSNLSAEEIQDHLRILPSCDKQQDQVASPLDLGLVAWLLLSECIGADESSFATQIPMLLHTLCVHLYDLPIELQPCFAAAADQILRGIVELGTEKEVDPGTNTTMTDHSSATESEPMDLNALLEKRVALNSKARHNKRISFERTQTALHAALQQSRPTENLIESICAFCTSSLPNICDVWAAEALQWATYAPSTPTASRSLQILRMLRPEFKPTMLMELLLRFAASCASLQDANEKAYASELLSTLHTAITNPITLPDAVFYALLRVVIAASTTPIESEFAEVLRLLAMLVDRCERESNTQWQLLIDDQAFDQSTPSLARNLLHGLRSAALCDDTFALLARLVRLPPTLAFKQGANEADEIAILLVATLPWCMQASDLRTLGSLRTADARAIDPSRVSDLGEGLARAAERLRRPDIARVAHSIARARFRSADELARQAAPCLANACAHNKTLGATLVMQLCDLLYCECEWVCRQSLLALRCLLDALRAQQADGAIRAMGPSLLDPVLALLSTPLAPLALDVLDMPALAIEENAPRNDQARENLRWNASSSTNQLFGSPSASGWGIANAHQEASRTRYNLHAVVHTLDPTLRYDFIQNTAQGHANVDELGSLASQLNDLASYFGEQDNSFSLPDSQTESATGQVAQILSRSAYRTRDSVLFAAAPPPLDAVLNDWYTDPANQLKEEQEPTSATQSEPPRNRLVHNRTDSTGSESSYA
ncbi:Cell morphogenesis protein PAG1 [Malassezia yamatoensis]|uniref:Cell morphogenesis protein PAG1 n=1 Tax=Malassezia yamatoensis TaxID=253288 RepID=A0AAJ6CEW9_9BASI|nr:Cell morphogenesis protein PAG1 [Malassezia yamatoensis]